MTAADIRRRLLAAGRHLNAHRFGWVVTKIATPGIDWGGSSKGAAIEEVGAMLLGRSRFRRGRSFELEDLEKALRDQPDRWGGRG